MAKTWTCERCHAENEEGKYSCSTCGMLRGAVVVPGTTWTPPGSPPESPDDLAASHEPEMTSPWAPSNPNSIGFASIGSTAAEQAGLPAAAQGVGAPLLLGSDEQPQSAGWVPPYPVAPPPSRPLWRRIPLGLVIFLVLVGGGAVVSFVTNASRSSSGDITKGGDLTSNELRIGDCWDMKDPNADTVDNVTGRPCAEPHEYEVFYIGSMAEGAYPTEDAFQSYVESTCVTAFGPYVGKGYHDSSLDISWLYPGSEGWASGDRTIECSLYDPQNSDVTGSLRSSNR